MAYDDLDNLPSDSRPNLLIPGAIVLAGVIIAGSIFFVGGVGRSNGRPGGATAADVGTALEGAAGGDLADDDPSLGDPAAPVTIVEFGDFQCPFCNRFFRETEREIIEQYVKTGKARFVYRDFAFLGEESVMAAEAAECADEQGKFWPYHDRLYNFIWDGYFGQGESGENVGAFSAANLGRLAAEVGLDQERFDECRTSRRYRAEVERDTADGRRAGVSGTPSTFVNGRLLTGALPFAQFQAVIEAALAGK